MLDFKVFTILWGLIKIIWVVTSSHPSYYFLFIPGLGGTGLSIGAGAGAAGAGTGTATDFFLLGGSGMKTKWPVLPIIGGWGDEAGPAWLYNLKNQKIK